MYFQFLTNLFLKCQSTASYIQCKKGALQIHIGSNLYNNQGYVRNLSKLRAAGLTLLVVGVDVKL